MSRFLGIAREAIFSPGRVADDGAILDGVAAALRSHGHEVILMRADAPVWPEADADTTVFTMAQGATALARLQAWRAAGVSIVNQPDGILNCQRHRTVPLLQAAGTPFPDTVLVPTDNGAVLPAWIDTAGAWVKRGDVHATEADDVARADDTGAVRAALRRFAARAIGTAVVQRHVPGTVVKFYGVCGRFFHSVPPADGTPVPHEVQQRIRAIGDAAARALCVEIFGGDCVFAVNGAVALIDLNDWPSYAACRAEAAIEIAAHLHARELASRR